MRRTKTKIRVWVRRLAFIAAGIFSACAIEPTSQVPDCATESQLCSATEIQVLGSSTLRVIVVGEDECEASGNQSCIVRVPFRTPVFFRPAGNEVPERVPDNVRCTFHSEVVCLWEADELTDVLTFDFEG